MVGELEQAIRARPDKTRYANTLVMIKRVTFAGESYGTQKCGERAVVDANGSDVCRGYANAILDGLGSIKAALQTDDLTPPET